MKQRMAFGLMPVLAGVMLGGCSLFFPDKLETKEFDVVVPQKAWNPPASFPGVKIGNFRNLSGAARVLPHRYAGNRMTIDNDVRLYQPIESILARDFQRCFGRSGAVAGDYVTLSGTILKFEIDDAAQCVVLELELAADFFSGNSRRKSVRQRIVEKTPLKDAAPHSAFEALGADIGKILTAAAALLEREGGASAETKSTKPVK